jgi:cobalamin synthase
MKDVEIGTAGSLTMIVLCTAMVFLMRSFYKRYTRMQKRGEEEQN